MTYARHGRLITLSLSHDEHRTLNAILAFACGAASREHPALARDILRFANELNRTNPDFTPFEIVDPSPKDPGRVQ